MNSNIMINNIIRGKQFTQSLNKILLKSTADISTAEFLIMHVLNEKVVHRRTVTEVGRRTGMTVITHTLDSLEKKGLLVRRISSEKGRDRRTLDLYLSDIGKIKFKNVSEEIKCVIEKGGLDG